jgi:saccharopine dehydrogenase (NAD+, L-lysine-forming)
MKIALIREGKTPPDSRVPMIPAQCAQIQQEFPLEVVVQPSPNRCFSDQEYLAEGVQLQENLDDCDILMGVKEVPIDQLIPNKTYFFFSHTIKKQSYNRKLLQSILEKNIRLIDYEVLTDELGRRLIAFGRFAGMVGAHNALYTYGERTGLFSLKRMKDCHDYAEAKTIYKKLKFPPVKIVLTGTGRVGSGAAEVLLDMGITQVSPQEFLSEDYNEPVFTQLRCSDYLTTKDGTAFKTKEFYSQPENFESIFTPYYEVADIMINGIYWDNKAPAFFSREDMRQAEFQIQVIADVTCDIAPVSSIPSTLKASTIEHPIFGYDPHTGAETQPHQPESIDMMTIDNLPNELPRDASTSFGQQFIEHILPELLQTESDVLERATITRDGQLTERFEYLSDYVSKHQ